MNIKDQKVAHKAFGTGVVTDQTDSLVTIKFDIGEKSFSILQHLSSFLCYATLRCRKV